MNRRCTGDRPGRGDPDPSDDSPTDRVTRLKQQIALGRYRVDPDAVAREILFKLRLLRLSRRALLARLGAAGAGARLRRTQ